MKDYSKMTGFDWISLLTDQPKLSIHADWSKLDGKGWVWLITDQPLLINTDELQIIAVDKSKDVLELLINPSERVKRIHALKWKI